jgi:hypothetical protein
MCVCMYELYVCIYVYVYICVVSPAPRLLSLSDVRVFDDLCPVSSHVAAVALRLAGASALPVSSLLCKTIPAWTAGVCQRQTSHTPN